ncbi:MULTISPECIES: alpha-galactosidase [Streptomyces]|uniref:Alpha-galactosidase n=1 Tax=Streptomyces lycii TaxID=2654337 RepID=A0ABQ7FH51_9ACTN|nr:MULTISPECIES: alpha-galactosidase [Streptomyces]KAF4408326.1 alpha-galactosidase [Streptomyces lycii]PGH46871.1 alpha-galactosidase [Streptomyces sp. Ru87]
MATPPASPGSGTAHLRAAGVSLVLDLTGGTLPRVLHWGSDLGPLGPAATDALRLARRSQPIGFSVDGPVDVAVLPEQSAGWLGTPGLAGHRAGRDFSTAFRVREAATTAIGGGPVRDGEGGRVTVRAADDTAGLELELELELTASGLVRQRASVVNTAGTPYTVDAVNLTLPVPPEATELLDFTGHHLRERHPQRTAFTHGLRMRENRTGRTGYDAAHLLVAGTTGFGARSGEVWGVHTAWSGNHRTFAERTFHAVSLLGSGELLLAGEVELAPGERYDTPWQYGSYGGRGLDELSARFHRDLRARAHHPHTPRPVVVNTWEAVYFDHDLTRLRQLADAAAAVGAERFVLDDGWFGARRDDRRALGDWYVSDEVWPDGLGPLTDHVTGLGMEFGLWVEPEMINEDSDLARAHPDWIMSAGDRLPGPARSQQVLDLARPEAYAYILERLDALLTEYPIGCLKWDHNRDLVEAGHRPTGRAGVHGQTTAVYRLLDELRRRHPAVEIESCSSGGGRVDLGILQRTDRVWVSDCIDALERQRIQRWTNALIPLELMGTHVGSGLAHTTDRRHPLDFRAGTALFGHFGIEWDLTAADPADVARLAEWVALYKELRGLLHTGTAVHGDHPDPAVEVHGVVAEDGSDALYAIVAHGSSDQYPTGPVRLPGLERDAVYRVRPQAPGDVPDGNAHRWGVPLPWWTPEGVELPGRVLEAAGVQAPVLFPERLVLLRATRV